LQVARGECVTLLGRAGAGKTTLCLALNGLVPHATGGVFRGDVLVLGQNTKQHAVADLARSVGLVFQDPESQLVQMRVEDEIAFGPENLGVPPAEIEERVTWVLQAVGLADYRDRSPLLLSGGEKQRVAIAAMLAMRPQVLVLDEPTANLDPTGKSAIFGVLAELRRQHEITIFVATQELERVGRFADRVAVLHDGRIALDGPPTEVFQQVARLQELGVGVPQMAELGHLLTQRTGRPYRFTGMTDAYRELCRQARQATAGEARTPSTVPVPCPPSPVARHPQIAVEYVSYTYADGTAALRRVNLTLHAGDYLALLGPNGAGKSTLARHFNGLLRPTRGRVLVEGCDTRVTAVAQLARRVGYAFQNPDHQIFASTVQEEIAFGPRMLGLPAGLVAQRVAEALDRFRLVRYADTPPALLGFGLRRKVALAAIIAMQPQVLILDEPTGGLDWRSQQELLEVTTAFNAQGQTVVLITHDMRLVAEYATRAVVLLGGQVLFDGTPRGLFARPEVLRSASLILPPVTRLANRLGWEGMTAGALTCAEFAAAWLARVPTDRREDHAP
jgi:energy-coupling factor transporter ATP-binding protein EcfA2